MSSNGSREEFPYTGDRYKDLDPKELKRRQRAIYKVNDVVRTDDGRLLFLTGAESPVEWEREGCFLEGIECNEDFLPIGTRIEVFMGLSVLEKVGHVPGDEVPEWEKDPVAMSMSWREVPAYIAEKGYRPPLWMTWMDVNDFLRNGEITKGLYSEVPDGPLKEAVRRAVAEERDLEEIDDSPYIPEWQANSDLLSKSREAGGEVFSYPAELDALDDLIAEAKNPGADGDSSGRGTYVIPYGFKSYKEYFSALRRFEDEFRGTDEGLSDAVGAVIEMMKEANHKEYWSVVRYTGSEKVGGLGLTPGRCYYWPCSPEHPQYEGVIDDEEFCPYLYPCDPDRWEIVDDPLGMAAHALAGEAETVDFWEVGPTELDGWAHENGLTAKRRGSYSLSPEEDPWGESEQDHLEFPCPRCGKTIGFDAWTKVNVRNDPELEEAVIDGSLFEFACPDCGYAAHLAHPCLYLDPEHRACVYEIADEGMRSGVEEMFAGMNEDDDADGPEGSVRRIVEGREALADKAAALSAGLDDRALELLKLGVAGQAMQAGQLPGGDGYAARFLGIDEGNLVFRIEYGGGQSIVGRIPSDAYSLFAESLSNSPIADEQPFYVDREWARKASESLG